jgi:hypothetical protein
LPDPPSGHPRTNGYDASGHLVPEDSRRADSLVHLTVEDVQVRAADPDVGDLDLQLTGRWGNASAGLNTDAPSTLVGSRQATGHLEPPW